MNQIGPSPLQPIDGHPPRQRQQEPAIQKNPGGARGNSAGTWKMRQACPCWLIDKIWPAAERGASHTSTP